MSESIETSRGCRYPDHVMDRQPRIQYEGAFYHVYSRGNRRERIFRTEADYKTFEEFLLEAMRWSGVFLYAWCLMPNHFHFVVQTPDGDLSGFMSRLLTRYAKHFNRTHKLVGHVFQGRFQSKVCDKETYFLELIRYVHLNPYRVKRAGFVPPGGWRWSSHRFYTGQEDWPEGTQQAFMEVLTRFGEEPKAAMERYVRFHKEGLESSPELDTLGNIRFLGSEAFIERVKQKAGEPIRQSVRQLQKNLSLEELLTHVVQQFGITRERLQSASQERSLSRIRQALVYVGKTHYRLSLTEMGKLLHRDKAALSYMVRIMEQKQCSELETLLERLKEPAYA